jgi:hypothetical protein
MNLSNQSGSGRNSSQQSLSRLDSSVALRSMMRPEGAEERRGVKRTSEEIVSLLSIILLKAGLWIRIRIGSGFSGFLDPDSESGSSGKKQRNVF